MTRLARRLRAAGGAIRIGIIITGGVAATTVAVATTVVASGGGGSCTTTVTTLTALTTAANAAAGGATICVNSSSYLGTWSGVAKTSPGITIKPTTGQTPGISLAFDGSSSAAWLTLDGIKLGGQAITSGNLHASDFCAPVHNVTIKNAEVREPVSIYPSNSEGPCSGTMTSTQAITFDNLDFDYADDPAHLSPNEGRIEIKGGQHAQNDGVTIQNSVVELGCADGLQAVEGGGTVVKNTSFLNVNFNVWALYPGCTDLVTHPDSTQFYCGPNGGGVGSGCGDMTFQNDYFYNGQVGIVDYDSQTEEVVITNTVFQDIPPISGAHTENPACAICLWGGHGLVIDHATMKNAVTYNGTNHFGAVAVNTSLTNSILQQPATNDPGGSYTALDHNYCISGTCTGTGSLNGAPAPSWVGGTTPTTFAGFALTGGSRGTGVASDSTNIGVNP